MRDEGENENGVLEEEGKQISKRDFGACASPLGIFRAESIFS